MSKFSDYCAKQVERERLIILLDGDLCTFRESPYRSMYTYLKFVKGIIT